MEMVCVVLVRRYLAFFLFEFASCHQQLHTTSKIFLQQHPSFLTVDASYHRFTPLSGSPGQSAINTHLTALYLGLPG